MRDGARWPSRRAAGRCRRRRSRWTTSWWRRRRATFSRVPLAERVYSRIKPSAAAQRLPPWRPSDALGPAGLGVFVRASGKPLTEGVPGFLTVDGFHSVLLPALPGATREVASESWVLGRTAQISLAEAQIKDARDGGDRAVRGRLRQGLGRLAAGHRSGAVAQPDAGGPGSVHPGLAAVADEGPADRHGAAADLVQAAAAGRRRFRRRSRRQRPSGRSVGRNLGGGAGDLAADHAARRRPAGGAACPAARP